MEPAIKNDRHFTYADYCEWDDSERWELIDGVAYAMSPAPQWAHQGISSNIQGQLYIYLQGKPCRVFCAPFDVRLNPDAGDDTVVQPDILVICDKSKLSGTGCVGAPDMVIEILSPSTAEQDMIVKLGKYMEAGVREYWIVAPGTRSVRVCTLNNGKYDSVDYLDAGAIPVGILEGCVIDFNKVFEE